MSAVSVDIVDANWRLFRDESKGVTPRGRSRLSRNRQTHGKPKHSGSRCVALAAATAGDLFEGLWEFIEERAAQINDLFWTIPDYSPSARRWEVERFHQDEAEIEERHRQLLDDIEEQYHETIQAVFKQDKRERLITFINGLKGDLAIAMVVASSVDEEDRFMVDDDINQLRRSLRRAQFDLELLESDIELLSPYASAA